MTKHGYTIHACRKVDWRTDSTSQSQWPPAIFDRKFTRFCRELKKNNQKNANSYKFSKWSESLLLFTYLIHLHLD